MECILNGSPNWKTVEDGFFSRQELFSCAGVSEAIVLSFPAVIASEARDPARYCFVKKCVCLVLSSL